MIPRNKYLTQCLVIDESKIEDLNNTQDWSQSIHKQIEISEQEGSAEAKTVRRLQSKVSFMDQKSAKNAVVNSHSVPAKIRINVKL